MDEFSFDDAPEGATRGAGQRREGVARPKGASAASAPTRGRGGAATRGRGGGAARGGTAVAAVKKAEPAAVKSEPESSVSASAGVRIARPSGAGDRSGAAPPVEEAVNLLQAEQAEDGAAAGSAAAATRLDTGEDDGGEWPPNIDSEHRPMTLPYGPNIYDTAKSMDAGAGALNVSLSVAGATGYGTSAAFAMDAVPLQCASAFLLPSAAAHGPPAWRTGDLLHFTLPATLPLQEHVAAPPKSPAVAAAAVDAEEETPDPSAEYRRRAAAIPAGEIGTLNVYSSGLVKLQIGDIAFDVVSGVSRAMYRQVVATMPAPEFTLAQATEAGYDQDVEEMEEGDGDEGPKLVVTAEHRVLQPAQRFASLCIAGDAPTTLNVIPNVDDMLTGMRAHRASTSLYEQLRAAAEEQGRHIYQVMADELPDGPPSRKRSVSFMEPDDAFDEAVVPPPVAAAAKAPPASAAGAAKVKPAVKPRIPTGVKAPSAASAAAPNFVDDKE